MRLHLRAAQLSIVMAALVGAAPLLAQGADSAEALFQSGKRLLEERRYDQACPTLEQSFRIDPATGTLLALAMCHEAEGKLASAWAEYGDVAARARREGRNDRDEAARQFRRALEPRLATLAIRVPPAVAATPGLVVTCDGVPVARGTWSVPVPIDFGAHAVDAAAPGRVRWAATALVQRPGDSVAVAVPPLASAAAAGIPRGDASPVQGFTRSESLRTTAAMMLGASVIAAVIGTVSGVKALHENSQSAPYCAGDICNPIGTQLRSSARSSGNASTISFIIAGALLGGSAAIYFGGRF